MRLSLQKNVNYKTVQDRRKYMIQTEKLHIQDSISYEAFLELHRKYGGRFSLKQFAYEVLNINAHAVGDMISIKGKESIILRPHAQKRNEIAKIKSAVIKGSGLHIGSQISYQEFQEIYKKYGKYDIDERDFALRILGITNDVFVRFKAGRRPKTGVFSTFPIDAKKISALREKVILAENLYIDQTISNERFQELYDKYAGILSEELFAEEILDINMESLRQARRRNMNNIILTGIELSEKYVKALQRQIINENGIQPNNQLMSLGEINELRKNMLQC
ncbi:MAG: hypothetical protein IKL55_04965 [Clostridia bacterium]|nr:hypothetical protein [Clostridia bacterium]